MTYLHNSMNQKNVEIEIKIGKFYSSGQFSADVSPFIYYKLISLIKGEHIINNSIICIDKNIRTEYFLDKNFNIINKIQINKKKIKQFNLLDKDIRVSIMRETPINVTDTKKGCFRYKKRISIINGIWQYDFTEIYDIDEKKNFNEFVKEVKKNKSHRYEVEIEYIGETDCTNKMINDLINDIDKIITYKYKILQNIQKLLKNKEYNPIKKKNVRYWNSKELMTQVQNLDFNLVEKIEMYTVTEKADGERFLLYIDNEDVITIDRSLNINLLNIDNSHKNSINKNLNKNSLNKNSHKNSHRNSLRNSINKNSINDLSNIITREKINNMINDLKKNIYVFDIEKVVFKNKILYLIFDCIIFNGNDISSLNFDKRYKLIKTLTFTKSFSIKKHYYEKNKIFDKCKKVYLTNKYPYKIDGLVFTPINEQYRANVYKWKPPELQTIDFLIIIKGTYNINERYVNKLNKNLNKNTTNEIVDKDLKIVILDLYVNNKKSKYNKRLFKNIKSSSHTPYLFIKNNKIPVKIIDNKIFFYNKFEKKSIPIINNTIIEMSYHNNIWIPHCERKDKNKEYKENMKKGIFVGPNGLYVAKNIVEYLKNPITTEMITSGNIYFKGIDRSNSVILNMLNFNNNVKRKQYNKYLKKDMNLLELAGGRGGDMPKFLLKNPKYVMLIDSANEAIIEARKRYNTKYKKEFKNVKINFKLMDLSKEIYFHNKPNNYDVICCNFAIHYFMKNENTFNTFMESVNYNIKKNGIFMFTCFDSIQIINLLKKKKIHEEVFFNVKNKKPLSITKLYNAIDTPFGNEIDVYVETIGKHPEYLVDIQYITDYLNNKGFELVENISFQEMFHKSNKLSPGERNFTGLYHKIVYKKK